MNHNNRTGRRYDREFKNNAVALVRSGRTVTEVARDLGVSLSAETAEQRELRRRRQEIEYVSRQRDILKKALGMLPGASAPALRAA